MDANAAWPTENGKLSGTSRRAGPSRTGERLRPVRLRMSAAMAARMAERAKTTGLTDSAYVRAVVGRDLSMDDPADLQPVRRYGGGSPDAQALSALRMQLHMLGGLLVQTAKVSRLGGDMALHADAEQTLARVREAIATVSAWQEATP